MYTGGQQFTEEPIRFTNPWLFNERWRAACTSGVMLTRSIDRQFQHECFHSRSSNQPSTGEKGLTPNVFTDEIWKRSQRFV